MFLLFLLQFLPNLLSQEFPLIVDIENGVGRCEGVNDCKIDCDYGFISNGSYYTSLEHLERAACVRPLGLVVGGYNQDWSHEEVFLASAELYSMTGLKDC